MADAPEPSFWSAVIPGGQKTAIDFSDTCVLTITGARLGAFPDNPDPAMPSRLIAHVQSIDATDLEDSEKEADEVSYPVRRATVAICTLRPGACERADLELTFSPFNFVEFENTGPIDIHLSGLEDPIEFEAEEDDEEEPAEEPLNPDEVQRRFKEMADAQPPRPRGKSKGTQKPMSFDVN
jgi:hypothetical protein